MIGMFSQHASAFLRTVAVLTAVPFSIPIGLAPMAWARTVGWNADSRSDLALYFGRCLGAVALVLSWAAWHAAGERSLQPFFFEIFFGVTLLLGLVHVVGALQRVQPWTETAEIPFWFGLSAAALLFYPG